MGTLTGTINLGGGPLASTVMGANASQALLAKIGVSGTHRWSRLGPGFSFDGMSHGAQVTNGDMDVEGITLLGTAYEAVAYGNVNLEGDALGDAFIVRLDVDGEPLWANSHSFPDAQVLADLALDDQGRAAVLGFFANEIDLGGGPVAAVGGTNFVLGLIGP